MENGEIKIERASTPKICPKCGRTNLPDAEVCGCGCSFNIPIEEVQRYKKAAKKKRRTWILITVVLFFVCNIIATVAKTALSVSSLGALPTFLIYFPFFCAFGKCIGKKRVK